MTPLTANEKETHKNQKVWYICKKEFSADKKGKHYQNFKKYYFHYTGQYRGATHSTCNLRYQVPKDTCSIS